LGPLVRELRSVYKRAVARAEIADDDLWTIDVDFAVLRREGSVRDDQRVSGGTAHRGFLQGQVIDLGGVFWVDKNEFCHGVLFLRIGCHLPVHAQTAGGKY
jgi:hypothetical protein